MKSFIHKNRGEFITFFLTAILLLFIFKIVGIFDHSILISDLRNAFYPFYHHLNKILHGDMGLYSFNLGMGDSFLGLFYFYMSSPFNLLLYFIKDINLFCIITILLKSALSSVFCYLYLKYQFKVEKRIYLISSSILYALSSFYLSYNMHVEFLDIYMLSPLLLLGIDKIVQEKKYLLYVISFLIIIFCNYYFAYMIAIFSMIYYNYKLFFKKIKWKKLFNHNVRFILLSFLICLSMSFVIIPIVSEIGLYSRGDGGLFGGQPLELTINLESFILYYLIGNFNTIDVLNPYYFYIYTSIVVFPLLYFYFINSKFSKRERILTSIVLSILILSISINYINYMWHGFAPPFCINGRFTFLFILFILMICTKSLYYLKRFAFKHYLIAYSLVYVPVFLYTLIYFPRLIDSVLLLRFVVIYLFVTFSASFLKKKQLEWKKMILWTLILSIPLWLFVFFDVISMMFLLKIFIILICIFLMRFLISNRDVSFQSFLLLLLVVLIPFSFYSIFSNIRIIGFITIIKLLVVLLFVIIFYYLPKKKYCIWIFLPLILLETVINGYEDLYRFFYEEKLDLSYQTVVDSIHKNDTSLFYRIEDNYKSIPRNDPVLYDYYGIDYFISTIKADYVNFFFDVGVKPKKYNINSIQYNGAYPLLASLLNVKYYVDTKQVGSSDYTKLDSIAGYDIYQNEDSLEFGYMVHPKLLDLKPKGDGLQYMNHIYQAMTNRDTNIFSKIDLTKKNKNSYSFQNQSHQDIYLLIELDEWNTMYPMKVYMNGELLEDVYYNGMYKIPNRYALGEDISITIKVDKKISKVMGVYAYYYDEDVYKEDIAILKENQMQVTKIYNNTLEGTIDTNKGGLLFLSCLDHKDLDIYVDGKKVKKVKLLNTFIGTKLSKGKHTILLKYKPKILYYAIVPSLVGICLLFLYLKKLKNTK